MLIINNITNNTKVLLKVIILILIGKWNTITIVYIYIYIYIYIYNRSEDCRAAWNSSYSFYIFIKFPLNVQYVAPWFVLSTVDI